MKKMKLIVEGDYFYIREYSDHVKKEMAKYDSKEVEMGKKVEEEHNGEKGSDLDVVKSEDDLMKIVLAHLREDPKYYTHLKSMEDKYVEESKKRFFTLEEGSGILTEAPHIAVGDQAVDLAFEEGREKGLRNILKAIVREEITDKYGSKFKLRSDKEVNEFISKIMRNAQVRRELKK